MPIHTIHEVFTPTKPAILTFIERESINARLVDALQTPGKQIIVYGHTGSGKTTLLVNKLHQLYDNHLTTRCMVGLTFEQTILEAFNQLGPFYESERSRTGKSTIGASLLSDYFGLKAQVSSETASKQTRAMQPLLNPQSLARFIGEAKSCLVFEDFHKLEEQEKRKLSQVMKLFADMSEQYPTIKIIAIGAVGTARQVVNYDSEMHNRVAEIAVPLMTNDELDAILVKGEQLLNIRFADKAKEAITNYANGLGSVCHQLALNCCIAANIYQTLSSDFQITLKDFEKAATEYVAAESDSIKEVFEKAVRQRRQRTYDNCRIILQALADSDADQGMTVADILTRIRRKNSSYPPGNLTIYLEELQSERRGSILRRDLTSGRYSFSNPFHKVYAQLVFSKGKKEVRQTELKLQEYLSDDTKKVLYDLLAKLAREALKSIS